MSADMDRSQQRIQSAMTEFVESLDKNHLRDMQRKLYECSAKCCGDKKSSRSQVENCIDRCQNDLKTVQARLEAELNDLQGQLNRCAMTCFDKQKQAFGPDVDKFTPDQRMQFENNLEKCVSICADDHIKQLPKLKDRIVKLLN